MAVIDLSDEMILQEIEKRKPYFDTVRLVNPIDTTVDGLQGQSDNEHQKCFSIWGKGRRCSNCISLRAFKEKTTMCKTECMKTSTYFVVSQYVPYGKNGAVIEMVKQISFAEELDNEQYKDNLTGLMNRAYFEEIVGDYLREGESSPGVFIILDIDDFKFINDSYGHTVGDETLKKVAKKLKHYFRIGDYICRLGGDEFALFIPAEISEIDLNERLAMLCAELFFLQKDSKVSCSIGACRAPEFGKDYQTLYENADLALLTAKRYGKNQYQIFCGQKDLPSHVLFRNMDWLLDEIADGLFVCDVETYELLYVNNSICAGLANKDKKDCLGKKCYAVLWNKTEPCEHCVALDDAHITCEHEMHEEESGRIFTIKGKLINWGGRKARVQYMQNITEKARLLEEVSSALSERDRILDMLPGGLFRYEADGNGEFNFVSNHMYQMLGYTKDEFTEKFKNRFDLMVWHEDRERVLKTINEQIADNDMDECDYRIEKKDGTLCWVKDIGHLVVDDDGTRWFYVTITDITSLKGEIK